MHHPPESHQEFKLRGRRFKRRIRPLVAGLSLSISTPDMPPVVGCNRQSPPPPPQRRPQMRLNPIRSRSPLMWCNPGSISSARPPRPARELLRKKELDLRPIYRIGQILETVPGLVVTVHSGEGKANQFFIRGFNLDHGTDFATFVDDMPVNEPNHAHGQGYTDIHFLMPELIGELTTRRDRSSRPSGISVPWDPPMLDWSMKSPTRSR